jgi:hypothetical protein
MSTMVGVWTPTALQLELHRLRVKSIRAPSSGLQAPRFHVALLKILVPRIKKYFYGPRGLGNSRTCNALFMQESCSEYHIHHHE